MEKIEYREATFNVIRTMSCERSRVKDEADNYLHTHWDFTVECNWQPAMVSYSLPVGTLAPIVDRGKLPGETDLALLTRLLQPRGLLKVTAGDSVILETPGMLNQARLPCDVKGGPSCEMVSVPVMIGTRHWVVQLRFVADVRDITEWSIGEPDTNLVVSNLWVGMEDIDYQRRSVRRFAGRAILRADLMRQAHVNANSFRDLLIFRCPEHYQRQNVAVQLSEDGTTLDWSFEDAMRGYDLGTRSEFVDIECFRTGVISCGSPARIAIDTVRHLSGMATLATAGAGVSVGASLVAAFAGATVLGILDNIPKSMMQCRCAVTGDRNANLGRQASIALGICLNQVLVGVLAIPGVPPELNIGLGQLLTGMAEIVFQQDVADQTFTSVQVTVKWNDSAIVGALAAGAVLATNPATLHLAFPAMSAALPQMRNDALALAGKFTTDSRTLKVPGIDAFFFGNTMEVPNAVASRDRAVYDANPPMTQSAFGVDPTQPSGTVPTSFSVGTIPPGIQNLIVQALVGQGETPERPRTLVAQS